MKTYTGTVTGQVIEKNRGSDNDVRMLQVEITEELDVQKVQQIAWGGDNSPINGDLVLIVEISVAYKFAIGVQGLVPTVESGERKSA